MEAFLDYSLAKTDKEGLAKEILGKEGLASSGRCGRLGYQMPWYGEWWPAAGGECALSGRLRASGGALRQGINNARILF
jgi:hypothetical protein